MSYPQPFTKIESDYHKLSWEAEGVVRVSFSRGSVNAWIDPMWHDLHRIFDHIRNDSDVRAVVLSGEGRCFTAGLDLLSSGLGEIMESGSDVARKAYLVRQHVIDFQAAITSMEKCEKPVVAAVHGVAYGLGIDLLSATDIRYASTDARFSIKEVDAALTADIGTLQRFPKIVGNDSIVRELTYTAREFSAEEALKIGFLGKVVKGGRDNVLAEAIKTASLIATKSPVAVRGSKVVLLHARDHTVDEGLDFVATWNMSMLMTDDLPVAMAAVMSKKPQTFSKL